MFHSRLELDAWLQRLPPPAPPRRHRWWRRRRDEPEPPEIVHGPLDVALVEHWRRTHPPTGKTTPADWFVWSTRPAEQPFLTRLGGVPHREAALPWPLNREARPRLFIGQICFLDSLDIVGHELPGDVLLVFGGFDYEFDYLDPEDYHLEWSRRVLREPLREAGVPAQPLRVPRLTGVIHRTIEDWEHVTQGTKIGATTLVIQGEGDEQILCALSFFTPRTYWPTLEHERFDGSAAAALGELALGDAGCIYVQELDGEALRVWSDCY